MVKRVLTALAALPLLTGSLVVLGASPAAAAVTCTISQNFSGPGGWVYHRIPAYLTSSGASYECVLKEGNKSGAVKGLQATLNECYEQGLVEDGDFGPATRKALEKAQYWERVVNGRPVAVDGVYGPETRRAMHWKVTKSIVTSCKRTDGSDNWP